MYSHCRSSCTGQTQTDILTSAKCRPGDADDASAGGGDLDDDDDDKEEEEKEDEHNADTFRKRESQAAGLSQETL